MRLEVSHQKKQRSPGPSSQRAFKIVYFIRFTHIRGDDSLEEILIAMETFERMRLSADGLGITFSVSRAPGEVR